MKPSLAIFGALSALCLAGGVYAAARPAPPPAVPDQDLASARATLELARQQQRAARDRGERLEADAKRNAAGADRSLAAAAALAARIQQAEAGIAAARAEHGVISAERIALDRSLAGRRAPLVRLTGALATMTRRPVALAAFQPGSLSDLVHTRAVLASTLPRIERETDGLRRDLVRKQALEAEARSALAAARAEGAALAERRRSLVALATRERTAAQRASGEAEAARELAARLARDSRDLDTLVRGLERTGVRSAATPRPAAYQQPVIGRVVADYAARGAGGRRATGTAFAPPGGAQVVSPAAGRIAFAGPYRGYGNIVIVEHAGGWTSLVTGLAALDTEVGSIVTAGSPLGLAPAREPRITLELRGPDGKTANPLP